MGEIVFEPSKKVSRVESPRTILDMAREAGLSIRADCGCLGLCGKCVVKVLSVEGELSPPTQSEISILGRQRLDEGYRLACQARLLRGRATVLVPAESLVQRYRSADIGLEKPVPLQPAVVFYRVAPPKPSLNDPKPDLDRILAELEKTGGTSPREAPLNIVRTLPETARSANWDLDVVLWYDRLVDVRGHSDGFRPMGVAVDIGTSKVVVHLVDLTSGDTLAIDSMPNPQAAFGADIISRLTFALQSGENLAKLHKAIVDCINTLIKRAAERASVPMEWIYEVVAVGNTVMHHLFLGIQPKYLGLAPYTPAVGEPFSFPARDLGINVNPNAFIHMPPVVAGFVGSDAVADAVAIDIDECREPCAMIDIGTNTEIILNTGKRIVAGSTPAGPAFEGAAMSFGMRAIEGAIDQVFVYFDSSRGDYAVRYNVVGGKKPAGICGSGYIDLVANLRRLGLLNSRGKFDRSIKSSRLVKDNNNGLLSFVVARADETSIGRDITVNEKDIDNLLLAKAAVASGFKMLLRYVGLSEEDLSKVFVAGSFGSYINIENAIAIGLLPKIPLSRFVFIGNAAVAGAKAMLKSRDVREKARRLARAIEYVELAAQQEYKKVFIESLYLP